MNTPHGHILIVEDEPRLAAVLGDYLGTAGYTHRWVADGALAMPAFHDRRPDLVLLDLMLPGRDGMDICRELRSASAVPVIMLTARVEEVDRLLGLEIGADDYICKPFSPREVVARVGAVLRRFRQGPNAVPSGTVLTFEAETYRANLNGHVLDLTPVEFRLLRDGDEIARETGTRLTRVVREPGAYRLEAWLTVAGQPRPWIYSNPIYLRRP